MSLIKKHELTAKKLAANRQNQKHCHAPVTPKVRERMRFANLRHGFYAKAEEVALRSLGEDPAQFQELLDGLWEEFDPVGSLQEGMEAAEEADRKKDRRLSRCRSNKRA